MKTQIQSNVKVRVKSVVFQIALLFIFLELPNFALGSDFFRVVTLGSLQPNQLAGTFRDFRLNNVGQVVGNVTTSEGREAAIWENGAIMKLGFYPGAVNGVAFSHGIAINDGGVVAGQVNDRSDDTFAAAYTSSAWQSLLYPSGYSYTLPEGINNLNETVGYATVSSVAAPYGEAFYSANDNGNTYPVILYPKSSDAYGIALGLNDVGEVVGDSISSDGSMITAVCWIEGGQYIITLGIAGYQSSAQAINNSGVAVGYVADYAVIFGSSVTVITTGVANAINENNFIVGSTAQSYTSSESAAWIYSQNEGALSLSGLQDSGLTLYTASDINVNLQIVGQSSGGGYIATPVGFPIQSGSWDSSNTWLWGLIPSAINPVTISNTGSGLLEVTGPNTSSTISELNVGGASSNGSAAIVLSLGQSIQVLTNIWGNGLTTIRPSGIALIDGTLESSVQNQGIVIGTGSITGNVSSATGSLIAPADIAPGLLSVFGDFSLSAGAGLSIEFTNGNAGVLYGQIEASGIVDLNNGTLVVYGSCPLNLGDVFTIVRNTSGSPVVGTFCGLSEGTIVTNFLGSSFDAQITYQGGAGYDVVLNIISPAAPNITNISKLAGGSIELQGVGAPGIQFNVQMSEDLNNPNWSDIGSTAADSEGYIDFVDMDASEGSQRFYRLSWP